MLPGAPAPGMPLAAMAPAPAREGRSPLRSWGPGGCTPITPLEASSVTTQGRPMSPLRSSISAPSGGGHLGQRRAFGAAAASPSHTTSTASCPSVLSPRGDSVKAWSVQPLEEWGSQSEEGVSVPNLLSWRKNLELQQAEQRRRIDSLATLWEQRFAATCQTLQTFMGPLGDGSQDKCLRLGEVLAGALDQMRSDSAQLSVLSHKVSAIELGIAKLAEEVAESKSGTDVASTGTGPSKEAGAAVEGPPVNELQRLAHEVQSLRSNFNNQTSQSQILAQDLHETRTELVHIVGDFTQAWMAEITGDAGRCMKLSEDVARRLGSMGKRCMTEPKLVVPPMQGPPQPQAPLAVPAPTKQPQAAEISNPGRISPRRERIAPTEQVRQHPEEEAIQAGLARLSALAGARGRETPASPDSLDMTSVSSAGSLLQKLPYFGAESRSNFKH